MTDQVNWAEQWALFAKNFKEGKAHIPIGKKTLLLSPGPGFGDLSHPTTYLMLKMMKKFIKNESVVDIGSGSGILTLAALMLGAKSAVGIDIDPDAIKHARKNAKLNHLKATFSKSLPKKLPEKNIILMNMILMEQMEVAPKTLNEKAKLWIVSGILAKQKKKYLQQAKSWGWKLVAVRKKSEWLGFIFSV